MMYTEYKDKDITVDVDKSTLGQHIKVLYRYKAESFLLRSHTYHKLNGSSTIIDRGSKGFIVSSE